MTVRELAIPGVFLIEPAVYEDDRGFFTESYQKERYGEWGIPHDFVQDNHSMSRQSGTVRGLHYQLPPMAQTKLVQVIYGAILDVVVDIRRSSGTFGKWTSALLTQDNHRQLLIPQGFAHGFCTLADNTHVIYKVDQYYSAKHDRGILWNDPELDIPWPFTRCTLSEKDRKHPLLHDARVFD